MTTDRQGEILEFLRRVEGERDVTIVYACESGSRAWGFASPDSDFDIRFIFQHALREYLGVHPPFETIEIPIERDLDAGGWDVRKAAALMGKGNGPLLEWLHSPIVYQEERGFLRRWRAAALKTLRRRNLADHYRGLAKRMWIGKLQGARARAKDYLYALRALACCRWALERESIPPVLFDQSKSTLPLAIKEILPELLLWKAQSGEGEAMERWPIMDAYIPSEIERLTAEIEALPSEDADREVIDGLYRAQLRRNGIDSSGRDFRKLADFTLSRIRQAELLLLDAVAGSHAHGTATPKSDKDRRGVFAAPAAFLFGLDDIDQVADEKNDQVYYELGRFIELLLKNNPNALEVLASPEDCVRWKHPAFDFLNPSFFLSKLCGQTFGRYALGQIRKARGLNKKIVNPQPRERKSLAAFCFVLEGQGTRSLEDWLTEKGYLPEHCGLVAARHAPNVYAIFHDGSGALGYRGIISPRDESALVCSSIPRDAQPVGWMTCNRDAFKAHCRDHREYWEWVACRNEVRYRTNTQHGLGYDSKNLMHTLRLLDMAEEIAIEGIVRVRRPNRDYLLRVRNGDFSYEDLVERAEAQMERVEQAFSRSTLPDRPEQGPTSCSLKSVDSSPPAERLEVRIRRNRGQALKA